MITTSHLIYNWAIAEKISENYGTTWWKKSGLLLGGILPDLPTYIFFVVHAFILGTNNREMWDVLYFDSAWTPFITLSHSMLIWPLAIAVAYATKRAWFFSLSVGALLHVILDFFVHAEDAYRHFWPLSDWQWFSPISYWDENYYGQLVGALDAGLVLLLLVYLFSKTSGRALRVVIVVAGVLYALLLSQLLL